MRRSFDRLALAARQVVSEDPRSGALFVFTNPARASPTNPVVGSGGFCLLCKRLHQALFRLPKPGDPSDRSVIIDARARRAAARRAVDPTRAMRENA